MIRAIELAAGLELAPSVVGQREGERLAEIVRIGGMEWLVRACREDSLTDRTRQEHDWANQAGTIGASRGASEGALPGKTCRHGWSFAPGQGAALVSVYTT